ncbi:unnamed protein product [Withania somnifera]
MNFLARCLSYSKCSGGAGKSKIRGGESSNGGFGRDWLLWFHDIGNCGSGEFSMAIVQANQVLEDQSQIESGPFGTFVGVYDGHGGPEAARYVCDHLFRHFQAISAEGNGLVTEETIQRAFLGTERGFTSVVSENWTSRPQLATVGSCCLVGAIYQQTLFVANLGDSRVVLGKKVGNTGEIAAIQLSTEHNANIESIRWELKDLHPDDPQIVVLRHGVWRVKGIIQVSRSIGDVYLKHKKFCREPINGKFRVTEPLNMPILLATPSILKHPLHPNDSFLIFASDGLWEHLSNEKAVEIVKSHPRKMRYSDLRNVDKKVRRHFHDDITVIVLFLNHDMICRGVVQDPTLSIRSAVEH